MTQVVKNNKPGKKWRYLKYNEIVRGGDQILGNKRWHPISPYMVSIAAIVPVTEYESLARIFRRRRHINLLTLGNKVLL